VKRIGIQFIGWPLQVTEVNLRTGLTEGQAHKILTAGNGPVKNPSFIFEFHSFLASSFFQHIVFFKHLPV
jgi:hypothetical protein